MNTAKKFRSCFIVDVQIEKDCVILTDSVHNRYYVDPKDQTLRKEFTDWFKTVFQKGIAQTLTVFGYEARDISECEQELHILKFMKPED